MPVPAAADIDVPLTECPEKIDTSIPANLSFSRSHQAIVQEAIGLCGLTITTKSFVVSLGLNSAVTDSHIVGEFPLDISFYYGERMGRKILSSFYFERTV